MTFCKGDDENGYPVSRSTIGLIPVLTFIALLTVCCIGLICFADSSDATGETEGDCGDGLTWSYNETTKALTISKTGEGSGVMTIFTEEQTKNPDIRWGGHAKEIVSVTMGEGVVTVGNWAFNGCDNLTSVTFPSTLTTIFGYSFEHCKSLSSIDFPQGLTTISNWAFYDCTSLEQIALPDSITVIGNSAFSLCVSVSSITLPNKAMTIGNYAFSSCFSLTSMVIPDGVTFIESGTFYNCRRLTSITIGADVESILSQAFSGCSSLTSITIPDKVTQIGERAFDGCAMLRTVTINGDVEGIGDNAFRNCSSLQTIDIPASVTVMQFNVFTNCRSLKSINVDPSNETFRSEDGVLFKAMELTVYPLGKTDESYRVPDGTTSIGIYAFETQGYLKTVELPDSLTTIGRGAFQTCNSLQSVTGNNVAWIKNHAFNECRSLETASLGNNLTTIEYNAFSECSSLKSIALGDALGSISDYTFQNCTSLTSVTMGNNVTSIGISAFMNCSSLGSITLSTALTNIKQYAFQDCTSLKTISIPKDVATLGDRLFGACTSLTAINVDEDNANFSSADGVLYNKDQTSLIVYPAGKTGDSYDIPDSVTSLGARAFRNCLMKTVNIPASVTSIGGDYVFSFCRSLEAINVDPENTILSSEGGVLFNKDKTRLIYYPMSKPDKTYTLPASVTSYAPYLFQENRYIESVTFGSQITALQTYTFMDCTSVKTVNIQGNVTNIPTSMFQGCTGLESVNIPSSVIKINVNAFYGCTSLAEVEFSGSYVQISDDAFYGCTSLTSVDLTIVTSLGDNSRAFAGCDGITEFIVNESNEYYTAEDGVLFNKKMTYLVQYPAAKEGASYTIPDSVIILTGNAFKGCSHLKSLILNEAVYSIASSLQDTGSLESITVDEKNTSYSARNGFLYDRSGVMLLACPSGLKSVTFDKDTLVLEGKSLTGNNLEEIRFVSDGRYFLNATSVNDCRSLKKIAIEDGAEVVFGLGSIASTAKEKQTIEVSAPEGFKVPAHAVTGNVKFTYGPAPTPEPEPEPSDSSGKKSNTIVFVAIGGVAVLALAGAAFFLIRRRA